LAEIKRLQAQGLTLVEIAKSLALGRSGVSDPTPSAWWNYQIADDVVVLVRADRSPWRMRQIQRAVREMAEQLDLEERGHDGDENR
jgi:DNA-binding transcriptional MerR regulator